MEDDKERAKFNVANAVNKVAESRMKNDFVICLFPCIHRIQKIGIYYWLDCTRTDSGTAYRDLKYQTIILYTAIPNI
jgi:hypothetical protein